MNSTPASRPRASPSSVVTCRRSTRSVLLPTSTTTTSAPRSARTSSIQRAVLTNDARSAQAGARGSARWCGENAGQTRAHADALVTSYTTTATDESRMYDGMSERKRSCPAVSLRSGGGAGGQAAPWAQTGFAEALPLSRRRSAPALRISAAQHGSYARCAPTSAPRRKVRRSVAPQTESNRASGRDARRAAHHSCSRTVRSSRYIVFDRKSMPIVACARARALQLPRVTSHCSCAAPSAAAAARAPGTCCRTCRT